MASVSALGSPHFGLHAKTVEEIEVYFRGANPAKYVDKLKQNSDKLKVAEENVAKLVQVIMKTFSDGAPKTTLRTSQCKFSLESEIRWVVLELNARGLVVEYTPPHYDTVGPIASLRSELVSEINLIKAPESVSIAPPIPPSPT